MWFHHLTGSIIFNEFKISSFNNSHIMAKIIKQLVSFHVDYEFLFLSSNRKNIGCKLVGQFNGTVLLGTYLINICQFPEHASIAIRVKKKNSRY